MSQTIRQLGLDKRIGVKNVSCFSSSILSLSLDSDPIEDSVKDNKAVAFEIYESKRVKHCHTS